MQSTTVSVRICASTAVATADYCMDTHCAHLALQHKWQPCSMILQTLLSRHSRLLDETLTLSVGIVVSLNQVVLVAIEHNN